MAGQLDIPPRFQPVKSSPQLDQGPEKYRIGLVALSNDYVTERDFFNMRPSDDVVIFTSRVPNTAECTVATLQEMAPNITTVQAMFWQSLRLAGYSETVPGHGQLLRFA